MTASTQPLSKSFLSYAASAALPKDHAISELCHTPHVASRDSCLGADRGDTGHAEPVMHDRDPNLGIG